MKTETIVNAVTTAKNNEEAILRLYAGTALELKEKERSQERTMLGLSIARDVLRIIADQCSVRKALDGTLYIEFRSVFEKYDKTEFGMLVDGLHLEDKVSELKGAKNGLDSES